ncbi:MAG TPA: hypothetical protein VFU88_18680 [Ktedonobacterales bacterium]|nr:hypothetical protein [Ktedonobacterales bacterium]
MPTGRSIFLVAALRYLMAENALTQADLAAHFGLPADVFIEYHAR